MCDRDAALGQAWACALTGAGPGHVLHEAWDAKTVTEKTYRRVGRGWARVGRDYFNGWCSVNAASKSWRL